MDRTGSIKENPIEARLPDFRNLGVWLRILLAVNLLALVAALVRSRQLAALPREFIDLAVWVEPVALASLLLLRLGWRSLGRLPRRRAAAATVAVAVIAAAGFSTLLGPFSEQPLATAATACFWTALTAAALLAWFDLRARAASPALSEARLMALTARIRPHFLFNSLNAVLGVIRSDPRQAEAALEELADLFRALMRDNRELVPLSEEIALARQYLALERLRLGDRLQVRWEVAACPPDALVPPLMLQPLLENAVYHGIEPLAGPGEVLVHLAREEERLLIEISNPLGNGSHGHGNQMAQANIRERLMLFFDLEGQLETEVGAGRYRVTIRLPYRPSGAGR